MSFGSLQKSDFSVVKDTYTDNPLKYPFCLNKDVRLRLQNYVDAIEHCMEIAEKITVNELNERYPVVVKDSLYNYLVTNINRVRVISYERSGIELSALIGEFVYLPNAKEFQFIFRHWLIDEDMPEDYAIIQTLLSRCADAASEEILTRVWDIVDTFEFIPLVVYDEDTSLSTTSIQYDKNGFEYYPVFSPVLGETILNTDWVMEGLEIFLITGEEILPDHKYLICEKYNGEPYNYWLKLVCGPKELSKTDELVNLALEEGLPVLDVLCDILTQPRVTGKQKRAEAFEDLYVKYLGLSSDSYCTIK